MKVRKRNTTKKRQETREKGNRKTEMGENKEEEERREEDRSWLMISKHRKCLHGDRLLIQLFI